MAIVKFAGRLAFPSIFEPSSIDGGALRYSAAAILADTHNAALLRCGSVPCGAAAVAAVNAAITEAATEKWKDKAPALLTSLRATDKLCLHVGDTKAQYDGFAGNHFVSTGNEARPTIVDRNGSPLVAGDGRPYAGCYCIFNVEVWAQDNKWGKRVNATLRSIQFVADGDSFAAGAPPAQPGEFDNLDEGAETAGEFA